MSRYDPLTHKLRSFQEAEVTLSFDELDEVVGGLPDSARTYHAWWANKRSSQPHAKAWLDAGRRARPNFEAGSVVFTKAAPDQRYWIFQPTNPDYHLPSEIATKQVGDEDEWPVVRNIDDMHQGDLVMFYQMRKDKGVYACGELISEPYAQRQLTGPYAGTQQPREQVVRVRYTRIPPRSFNRTDIAGHAGLAGMHMMSVSDCINPVTPEQWQALEDLMEQASAPRTWWVNQGGSYQPLEGHDFLWCPQRGQKGQKVPSWSALTGMALGDVVLHYSEQKVRAVSRVVATAEEVSDPSADGPEAVIGWKVDVEGRELPEPIQINDIPHQWRVSHGPDGPFNTNGQIKQGYAYSLDDDFIRRFAARFARVLPPDMMKQPRVWAIAVGREASYWPEFRGEGVIAIGLGETGDLQGFESKEALRQAMIDAGHGDNPMNDVLAGWQFANEMKPGDLLIAKSGRNTLYGYGVITSEYRFDASRPTYRHVRSVEWRRTGEWSAPDGHGIPIKTLTDLTSHPELVSRLFEIMGEEGDALGPGAGAFDRLVDALFAQGLYFSPELITNYLLALQAKRFAILTGISGTGKTQLALAVARHFQPQVRTRKLSQVPEGAVQIQVSPSMAEQGVTVPVAMAARMRVTQSPEPFKGPVRVRYPQGEVELRLSTYPKYNQTMLSFRGAFKNWFRQQFQVGDRFLLSLETDDVTGDEVLQFLVPASEIVQQPLDNHRVVPVRPDWTDNRGLLGYYNPITESYATTEFLRLVLHAAEEEELADREGRQPHPYFVILDEMNLARVEHYFSDFLSALESGQPIELHHSEVVESLNSGDDVAVPRRLRIPQNLFITGTVNVDETTYMFSPKVLDRAFTIELNDVDLSSLGAPPHATPRNASDLRATRLPEVLNQPGKPMSADWADFGALLDGALRERVIDLNEMLASDTRHFGYRVANEIARFVLLAAQQTIGSEESLYAALDLAILQKVLPKFHGTQQELEGLLERMLAFAIAGTSDKSDQEGTYAPQRWTVEHGHIVAEGESTPGEDPLLPRTGAKVWRMLDRVRKQGFTSYVE